LSKLIGDFAKNIKHTEGLYYSDFLAWLEKRNPDLKDLSLYTYEKIPTFDENTKKIAEKIFLEFQSFLALFLHFDNETIRFLRIYESFRNTLRKCLSEVKRDYGDIYLIIDEDHEKQLISTIKNMAKDIKEKKQKEYIQIDEHLIYKITSLENKSKSGIGKGINYSMHRPSEPRTTPSIGKPA
jgi:hypothetical protein